MGCTQNKQSTQLSNKSPTVALSKQRVDTIKLNSFWLRQSFCLCSSFFPLQSQNPQNQNTLHLIFQPLLLFWMGSLCYPRIPILLFLLIFIQTLPFNLRRSAVMQHHQSIVLQFFSSVHSCPSSPSSSPYVCLLLLLFLCLCRSWEMTIYTNLWVNQMIACITNQRISNHFIQIISIFACRCCCCFWCVGGCCWIGWWMGCAADNFSMVSKHILDLLRLLLTFASFHGLEAKPKPPTNHPHSPSTTIVNPSIQSDNRRSTPSIKQKQDNEKKMQWDTDWYSHLFRIK